MSQIEITEDNPDQACRVVESTNEFVDEVCGSEIAAKLFEQIEQLQM